MNDLRVQVLGPTAAVIDGQSVVLGGPRQRRLLAALAINAGEIVIGDRLIDRVWSDENLPSDPRATLRTYIARLRQSLQNEHVIVTEPLGWRLSTAIAQVDAVCFVELVEAANEPGVDVHRRLALLDEALRLWHGDAYEEVAGEVWARSEADRLNELRVTATERRYDAMLNAGMHTDALPGLAAEVEHHPLRDRLVGLQMLALFRSGRQAEASRVFQAHRDRLADELGLGPGVELVALDRRIVAGDASLHLVTTPGRALRGYRLGEQLGEGAFAVVYRGTQPSVGRDVAVKVIRADLANRPEFVRRFEAEAHLVARLEHPYIVPLYDYWREPDRACLVFRYLRGGTLEAELNANGGMPIDACRTMVEEVGAALATAHAAGIVHRDVKPANVLLDEAGNFYLGDFGIALEAAELSDPTAALSAGSPAYASPEQLRREPIGPSADVHGLAISIYQALTGRLPFPTAITQADLLQRQLHNPIPSVSDQRGEVPATVDAVLAKATAKAPADRYQTIEALVDAFVAALDGGPVAMTVAPGSATRVRLEEPRNPYKGLRSFTEADSADFFGRERLVDRLVDVLSETGTEGRIAAVVGPSGIGKSSVVRAGLLPALRRGAVPRSGSWFIATMLPGPDPFEELGTALLRVATRAPANMMSQLTADHRGLARVVKALVPEDDPTDILLVIDQFEELFTLVEDSTIVRQFLDALDYALTDARCPLRVVLTMRADFWDRPLRHGTFARLIEKSTVTVTALAPDELERAITEPGHRAGVEFEPGLVSEIIADVTDQPGALPLLQYALTELFEREVSGLLTRSAYRELGGVAGALGRRAEELYLQASAEEQAALRRIFGRLVSLGEGIEDTRRRALRSELGESLTARAVIDRYGEARLLSFDRDPSTREPTVEVAHEALLREWPRLRGWLEEDRDGLRILRHLNTAATEWDTTDRPDAELYRGGRLEVAEGWAADHAGELTEQEGRFLARSIKRRAAEQDAERRTKRRLRRLLTGVAAIAVIAVIAGSLAFVQRDRANEQLARAAGLEVNLRDQVTKLDRRRLIAESANQIGIDRRRGLLLALEAHAMVPDHESLGAVQRVLVRSPLNWIGSLGTPMSGYTGATFLGPGRLAGAGRNGVDIYDIDSRVITWSIALDRALSDEQASLVGAVRVDASADGSILALATITGEWLIVDGNTGATLDRGLEDGPVTALAVAPHGSLVAIALESKAVRLVDPVGGVTSRLWTTDSVARSLSFDDEAARLAILFGDDGPGTIRDVGTGGNTVANVSVDVGRGGPGIAVWQGENLFVGGLDRAVLLDPESNVVTDVLVSESLGARGFADVGSDGVLVLTGLEGDIEVLTPGATATVVLTTSAQVGQPEDVAYEPTTGLVALAGSTGIALISSRGKGTLVEQTLPLAGPAVEISEVGDILMSSSGRPPVEVWRLGPDPARVDVLEPYYKPLNRNNQFMLAGLAASDKLTIDVWNDGTTSALRVEPTTGSPITFGLSPDGRWAVVSTSTDGRVQVFDRQSGQPIAELTAVLDSSPEGTNPNGLYAPDLEFKPDGSELIVTVRTGAVHFYDTATWTESREPIPAGQGFHDIDFASDSNIALTFDWDRGLELRSAETYEVIKDPIRALGSFGAGGQSPDILAGDRYAVVSGSQDGAIIWDLEAFARVGDAFPYDTDYRHAAVASEAMLLAGVHNGETLVWNVDVDSWPDIACRAAGRNLTVDEWEAYGPDLRYRKTCPQFP